MTPDVGAREPGPFNRLQALDDAIAFRAARAAMPCPDCAALPAGRCDDHGTDLFLIGQYRNAQLAAVRDLPS